jgi:hypothetical protein
MAFVTAGLVFALGQLVIPQPEWARERPLPPPLATIGPAAVPAPVAPAPSPPPAAGATPPAPTELPAKAEAVPPAGAATEAPPTSAPAPTTATVGDSASRRAADKSKGGNDREVARAAWRKNLPDVSGDANRAAILIPIRGSIAGATHRLLDKPRGVLITLPKAESMISMELYKVRRDGFLNLWIKHEDSQGTTLRVMLGDASDPQVEINEDFVRVTVQKVAAAAAATPSN